MTNAILQILDPESYIERVIRIIRQEIVDKKRSVIYVTATRTYAHLAGLLKGAGVPLKKVFFIDCISTPATRQKLGQEPDNCIFLDSPEKITDLCIAIAESIKHLPGDRTLILDSLSTLLVYIDVRTAGRFSHFLLDMMRTSDIDIVILTFTPDAGKDIVKTLGKFAEIVR